MLGELLTLRLNGRINDYLLCTDGAGPSANSKCQLEGAEVPRCLLEYGPTPSIRFLEIELDLSRKRKKPPSA